MVYVGIDQSYTGFGLVVHNPSFKDPIVHLGKFEAKHYGTDVLRLLAVEDFLRGALANWTVDHVCMEGYSSASKFGREKAGELGYAVKRALWHHPQQLVPTIVQPTALKKYVTGKGKGDKNVMLLNVYKRWGVEFDNDNLSDAYALARLAEDIDFWNRGDADLPKYQREVIEKLVG